MKEFLSSKLHHVLVTESRVDYMGSIQIDEAYMEAVGLEEHQKVLVVSMSSGVRLETYVIKGERGSSCIGLNGAAAHLIKKGERVIIMGFSLSDTPLDPCIQIFK